MRIKIEPPKNIYALCFLVIAFPFLIVFVLGCIALVLCLSALCVPFLIGVGIYHLIKKLVEQL